MRRHSVVGRGSYDEVAPLVPKAEYYAPAAILARIVSCVSSLAEGYDVGCFGAIAADIKEDLGLSSWGIGILAGVPALFFALAALCGGALANAVGRKAALMATCVLLIAGIWLQVVATGLSGLVLGRCIVNAGAGAGVAVVSTYLTEVTPAARRGCFVSLEELFLQMGILLAYFAQWCLVDYMHGWRIVIGLGMVGPVLALLLSLLPQVPESPRYFYLHGEHGKAEQMLRRLVADPEEVEQTLAAWDNELPITLVEAVQQTPRGAFVASLGVALCTTASGVHAINQLLSFVLVGALKGSVPAEELKHTVASCTLAIMGLKFAVLLPVCLYLVDRVGRRPLLVASALCMAVGSSTTTMALAGSRAATLVVVGIGVHLASFSLGMGPVMWAYCSEVLPTEVRGPGMGLAILASRCLVFVQLSVLPVALAVSFCLPFACYAVVNLAAATFVMCCCPETSGKKLEELPGIFN
mmetsp:Transcript_116106/g.375165  ORF Transcript_116106/g.375165 Transcript_116106/m.375165 type:complete len:468 (+) Transcript_116106:68-1471(+)